MFIQQLYTNCLAQAAYYIESEGEAIIIDPLREPYPYLDIARQRNTTIKYVFETHFHADFVSGHVELARQTGATIVYGPNAKPGYQAHIAKDHEKFKLGKITLELLHTPGHTIESACYLLYDELGKINSVFTGDCLFVGDVGRPDLLSGNLPKEDLASLLFDSLNNKLKTLPDDVIVYPGHGAGSACGKNLGKEATSTIGQQKNYNYALQEMSREAFIRVVTENLPTPPPYFFKDAKINIEGYGSYADTLQQELHELDIQQFQLEIQHGSILLDTRSAKEFSKEFIPGSINIGLDGGFAVWVGALIPFGQPLVLICPDGKEQETIIRLARIGYDTVKGFLKNGLINWKKANLAIDSIENVESSELEDYIKTGAYSLIDVRNSQEIKNTGKLINSISLPLDTFIASISNFHSDEYYLIYCAGGYRSMMAASLLKRSGIIHVLTISGGINKVKEEAPVLLEA